jgi:hypothetical protein
VLPATLGQTILRWLARIFSLLPITFVIVTIVHEGSNPIGIIRSTGGLFLFFPIGVSVGFLRAWRWELIGSVVSLANMALFYVMHHVQRGRYPGGPWFLVFLLPAMLFLASWTWRRLARRPIREAIA